MSQKITALTEKTTIVADDLFVIADSAAPGNKKVKASNVKKFANGWIKYSFTFASFQPAAGISSQIEVGANIIPQGGLITGVKIKHSIAFGGGGITSADVEVYSDDTGPGSFYTGPLSVFGAPAADFGKQFTGYATPSFSDIPSQAAASKFYLRLTVDGAHVINDLTAGALDVWVKTDTLPL